MYLTLLRHAQTETGHPGQNDWERELEPRGRRDAPEIARRLYERQAIPTLIVSSPAVRALETARLAARIFNIPEQDIVRDDRLYLATAATMLQVARERGGVTPHLMIVGHNPGLTEFGNHLSAERTLDGMPTCAAYTLRFDIDAWAKLDWAEGFDGELIYPGQC
jgi:phosphohistidine phosphatase